MSGQEASPWLRVEALSVAYDGRQGPVAALDRISFQVAAQEKVALVGESGSGKSTIAKAILGLLPAGARIGGAILQGGRDLAGFRQEQDWLGLRGRQIALIPQDPQIALDPVQRVGLQLVEALRLHRRLDPRGAEAEALRLLDDLALRPAAEIFRRYPHQLSGGQLQRILIAIALSGEPGLIIADEPTSGLDVTAQKTVLEAIGQRVRQAGTALLLITHDLAIARRHADRIIVLRDGRIVEELAAGAVAQARDPYTRALFEAMPSRQAGRRPSAPPGEEVLARFERVSKRYPARRGSREPAPGIGEVSLTLRPGRSLGLVGESGSGKSTTARIAAGLVRPDAGAFAWLGGAGRPRPQDIQMVFQNPFSSLNPKLTVEQIIREPLDALAIGERAGRPARIRGALQAVGLGEDFARRRPPELSGGQCQRVAIARAIVVEPRLLILDEPVSALDVTVQAQVLQLLVALQARLGLAYLFISHDLGVVRSLCDEVAIMRRGEIVEQGSVEAVFAQPRHDYTRALLAAIP